MKQQHQQKPRVAYVLKVFPRLSETFILNEILELERQGFHVEIFSLKTPMEPRFHAGLSRLGRDVTYLPPPDGPATWRRLQQTATRLQLDPRRTGQAFLECLGSSRPGLVKHFMPALYLAARLGERGIQHMHAHFASSATQVALLAHQLSGVPFSFTAHAKDIYHENADLKLLESALDQASFAVTVTDFNARHLTRIRPEAADRIQRIYNGIGLRRVTPVCGLAKGPPLVLAVGRLVEKKGFGYLLESCRILRDRGADFHCQIVGTGQLQNLLESSIRRLGIGDHVQLLGARSQESVLRKMAESRLLVLPCIVAEDGNRDALPTVLLEAMALGKPTVSTLMEGVDEIVVPGETGLLVNQRDSVALADAIETILTDPERAEVYGRAARKRSETHFDLERNVARLGVLFRQSHESPAKRCATGRTFIPAAQAAGFER